LGMRERRVDSPRNGVLRCSGGVCVGVRRSENAPGVRVVHRTVVEAPAGAVGYGKRPR